MAANTYLREIDDTPIVTYYLKFHLIANDGSKCSFFTVTYWRYGKSERREISAKRAHAIMRHHATNHKHRFAPECTHTEQASDYHHEFAGKSNRKSLFWEV